MPNVTKRLQSYYKNLGSVTILKQKTRITAVILAVACVFSIGAILFAKGNMSEVKVESITRTASLEKDAVLENDIVNPNDIVKYGTVEEALLNAAPLAPMLTNDTDLDRQIAAILSETTDSSMSTYEKVLAVYEYMETNFNYSSSSLPSDENYESDYDSRIVGRAKGILTTGHGTCTEYSAAFMTIMRAIGLECYSIGGRYGGGQHTWTIIVLGDKQYIFDPEIDFRNWQNNNKTICLGHFCMNESFEYFGYYHSNNVSSSIDEFGGFEIERNLGVSRPLR